MQSLIVLCSLIVVAFGQSCFDVSNTCKTNSDTINLDYCNAVFGGANQSLFMDQLTAYANVHITRSFEYMLMSSHFGNYQENRRGFQKVHRKLSDTAWEDAIDLIKYITMRGGKMDFHFDDVEGGYLEDVSKFSELASLAKALDTQKKLAKRAHKIYKTVHNHDPEISSYLEDKFMHKHATSIRELSGYTHDLIGLTDKKNEPVGLELFVFDHYLQKS